MTTCPPPSVSVRLAAAQAQSVAGDIASNVAKVVELVETAAKAEVQLVVFPEKFLSGYEPDLIRQDPQRYAIAAQDIRLTPILNACARTGVAAIVGAATYDEPSGPDIHISSLIINGKGQLLSTYHKQHLFSSERGIFCANPVNGACLLELTGWRLGMAICYDSAFAEHARSAALAGCDAYLVSALFSKGNGHHESRVWMPARALDNTMFVLLSNHVGNTGGWQACGGSAIWSPYGKLLAEAGADEAGLIICTLDPALLAEARSRETMLADYRASTTQTTGVAAVIPGEQYQLHRLG